MHNKIKYDIWKWRKKISGEQRFLDSVWIGLLFVVWYNLNVDYNNRFASVLYVLAS